jgi:hypothetical protein
MNWEFLERWKSYLRLVAYTSGDRDEATTKIRKAFDAAGAWMTDVHFFSGVQTVFNFEVAGDRVADFAKALEDAGLSFDDASREVLAHVAAGVSEFTGTLAVVFAHGDPDQVHEVPAVPG